MRCLFALLWFSLNIFCLTEGLKLKDVLRKRRQSCEYGTYTDEKTGLECCLCPPGYYVQNHCTQAGGDPECELCEDGVTFMDDPNGEERCELCSPCEDSANREVYIRCTPYANTVCRCKDGHYCDKGNECTACYACDKCEGLEVKVPCTASNNTVCKDEPPKKIPESLEVDPLLEDVDLTDFLPEIAHKLGLQAVKDVTRRSWMLTDVEMENVEHDYPNAKEQTFQLLKLWYQKHGLKGAYNRLVNNLINTGHRSSANQVQQIVK
ncbi:tumor necrosis factor receptor superfamily member 6-like isoform X2 [Colossoma macropomum]|uniref:tumor necrosis factor receptor superfamily member 6-like isoform X2 n=1 Tax=Colossoma macropomum TaxID=42526 RepID=UPI001863B7C0|nr:tumor necrosis factor receptor superfamily member 6-like isoform X2 [Colossoma macropomum]